MRYFIVAAILLVILYNLKKNNASIVCLIFLLYTNIGGLLSPDEFFGLIGPSDIGFVIAILFSVIVLYRDGGRLFYLLTLRAGIKWVFVYFLFTINVFIYSIFVQEGIEWPLKLGRYFLYGVIFVPVIYYSILNRDGYKKNIELMLLINVILGVCYILYNIFGFDFYPMGAHETVGEDEVVRNFSGYSILAPYFLLYCLNGIFVDKNKVAYYFFGFMIFLIEIFMTMTRGLILTSCAAVFLFLLMGGKNLIKAVPYVGLIFVIINYFASESEVFNIYYDAIYSRFSEFFVKGLDSSDNAVVRSLEFSRILSAVVDFNPLFGFGYVRLSDIGYENSSLILYAGSADNGFTNIIGTSGFVGLFFYIIVYGVWFRACLLNAIFAASATSRVGLIFCVVMFVQNFNGSYPSYLHNIVIILAIDLSDRLNFIWKKDAHLC